MINSKECLQPSALKEYLAGWTSENETLRIEQHLAECPVCEQTIVDLEGKADTMIERLRRTQVTPPITPNVEINVGTADEVVGALERAKKLMIDPVPEKREPWIPPPGDIGAYELIKPLGRGGMATVYMARHRQLGKIVAIKLLPVRTDENEDAAPRFQREIRAAGRLNHPSIVSATDAGHHDGTHYLVMEYVEGMDLSRLARLLGPLPIAEACEIIRQVALGLAHAHAEGIVHRDVKPSNLMLDAESHVKILDFGLAQLNLWDEASAELTTVGQLMGTLDYMSPEQAERSSSVDYRADLYSLGATMFRLLCGRAPLAVAPNLSPLEKLKLIAHHDPLRLDTLRPDAPPELVQIVAELLSRSPDSRPASAAHVAQQLVPLARSADLISLMKQAQAAALKTPESIAKRTAALNRLNVPIPQRQNKSGRRTRRPWLIIAAAFLPFAILGGILIILETQKGQLIIESDIPDIQVTISSDKKNPRELTLAQGPNVAKLYAGEYVVTLNKASDSISLDEGKIVIKSGEIKIAHVREKPTTGNLAQAESALPPSSSSGDELQYAGKSLSQWLEQLARDRSPQAITDSLIAIKTLVNPNTSQQITEALLTALPNFVGKTELFVFKNPAGEDYQASFAYEAFQILAVANPRPRYAELVFKLLESSIAQQSMHYSEYLLQIGFRPEDVKLALDWIDQNILQQSELPLEKHTLRYQLAKYLTIFLRSKENYPEYVKDKEEWEKLEIQILRALENCKALDNSFWLSTIPEPSYIKSYRQAIVDRAKFAIVVEESSPKEVTQAAMILAPMIAIEKEMWNGAELRSLANTVQTRLEKISHDETRMFAMVSVDESQSFVSRPSLFTGNSRTVFASSPRQFNSDKFNAMANETIELLDLAAALKHADITFDARKIMDRTKYRYDQVRQVLPAIFATDGRSGIPLTKPTDPDSGTIQIEWPSLRNVSINRGGRSGSTPETLGGRGRGRQGGGRSGPPRTELTGPSPIDWLSYFIYYTAAEVSMSIEPFEENQPAAGSGRAGVRSGSAPSQRRGRAGSPPETPTQSIPQVEPAESKPGIR